MKMDTVKWLTEVIENMEYLEAPGDWVSPCRNAVQDITSMRREIERLHVTLKAIRDIGPMTVDDQRWRLAKEALNTPQKSYN